MYNINTDEVRQFFARVWQSREHAQTLSPLERKVLDIVKEHPEYHATLAKVQHYLHFNWSPELGQTNPFLHLSLHLAIQEQTAIDQPFGIAAIHRELTHRMGQHKAEHTMMEALSETIWLAQRHQSGLDVNRYITQLRRLVDLGQEDEARLNPHEVATETGADSLVTNQASQPVSGQANWS